MFVARNGRAFMSQIAQKESRNFLFDFLQPNHSFFPYFTKLIEQYSKVMLPSMDMKAKVEKSSHDRYDILARCSERAEWERYMMLNKKRAAEEEEEERSIQVDSL